ncbi:dehydrogenase, partial [Staphylococcus aureus]|uniref:Gfo/Idh/MocA family oxidoreductase n=1 Tax=Staphylococcus aureus TaxID=1280 RepID=UPI00073CB406
VAQDRQIPAFLKLKDTVSLVAVQDINTVQMIDVAKRLNIPHAVETPSELFKLVVAVVIWTPNKFQADLSIEALNHGDNVLREKPMAMTPEEG